MSTYVPTHHAQQARDSLRALTADLAEGRAGYERPKDVVRTVAALRALAELLPTALLLTSAELSHVARDPEATAAVRQLTQAAVTATDLATQLQEAHRLAARTRPRPPLVNPPPITPQQPTQRPVR